MIAALSLLPLAPLVLVGGVLGPIYVFLRFARLRSGRDHADLWRRFVWLWLLASGGLYAVLAAGVMFPPRFAWVLDFLEHGGAVILLPLFVINFVSVNLLERALRKGRNQLS